MSFKIKLKNYNLQNPEEKRYFNLSLFKEVAPKYNFISKALSFGMDLYWKRDLVKFLPEKEEAICLDIACGTGDIAFLLAEKFNDSQIIGLDQSPEMIRIAEDKNKFDNVEFIEKNMTETGFTDESIDYITGGYAVRNSPDVLKTFKELYRILKAGGIIALLDFSKPKNKIIQAAEYFILKFWGSLWGLILHGNPDVYAYIAESLRKFPDRNKLEIMLNEIGFKIIKRKLLFFGILELLFIKK